MSLTLVTLGRPGGILPLQAWISDVVWVSRSSCLGAGVRSQRALLPQGSRRARRCQIQMEQVEEVPCPGRAHLQSTQGSEHRLPVEHPAKLGWLPAPFLFPSGSNHTIHRRCGCTTSVSSSSPRNTHGDGLEQVTMAMCALPWRQHFSPLPVIQNESLC